MTMGRTLGMWLGREPEQTAVKPRIHQVCYSLPNLDSSRKMCGNCVFLCSQELDAHEIETAKPQTCCLYDEDVLITPDMICSYHVFGRQVTEPHEVLVPLVPEYSGLRQVPGGVSCDLCTFFVARGRYQGTCSAVDGTNGGPALVAALGLCSRWVGQGGF